jgi:hypothetical protein
MGVVRSCYSFPFFVAWPTQAQPQAHQAWPGGEYGEMNTNNAERSQITQNADE